MGKSKTIGTIHIAVANKKIDKDNLFKDIATNIYPALLNKKCRLNDSEYEIMKTHAEEGYRKIFDNKGVSQHISLMAFQHHENNDGTGYPKRLHGDQILFEARIIHVVDV